MGICPELINVKTTIQLTIIVKFPADYDGQSPARPRSDQRPRGSMHLMGAVIAPSEEDSQTFNVNAANGEIYKLRAHDAKERQYWVSGKESNWGYGTVVHFATFRVRPSVPSYY